MIDPIYDTVRIALFNTFFTYIIYCVRKNGNFDFIRSDPYPFSLLWS